ncbi:MAG: hypothetical protein CVT99_09860 [Bacteroidetes bacterium HGW-Bacteroidetes-16]|jgi:hypothetical protein|nr:MAG: hypothetical protein CVT99_09860 [Bacteroidetes bacterium HGW-Bacteroidetes-16]
METKKIIEKIALTLFAIIILQNTYSQENYLPGYILPQTGDTLHGYIDYRNWDRNPDKISFRNKLSGEKHIYSPMDIEGFSVLDERYESAIVQSESSPMSTGALEHDADLEFTIDTTFLQTMITGKKSLYFYMNNFGKEQFYIKQDSSYELLVYKRYLREVDGVDGIGENKRFIGQLTIYLADCPKIQSKLNNTEYRKKSMENLFLYFYNCTNSEVNFQKKTEKISVEIGVLGGLTLTSLKFKGTNFDYLVNANYNQSVNFSTGIFFDVILSRNQAKWSIYNELTLTSYNVAGRVEEYWHENRYIITHTKFAYTYLNVNNMVRYKYPIGGVFVFLNGGISTGFTINETNYKKVESTFFDIQTVEEGNAIDGTRKLEIGYILGIGIKYKRFSFETRYDAKNGMSEYTDLKSTTKRYYFLLGYRF